MLAAWVLIGFISMQQSAPQPRFTLSGEAGDRYIAELFELNDNGTGIQYRALLDLPVQAELDIQPQDSVVYIAQRDSGRRSRILVAASSDNTMGQGRVCRLTRRDNGGRDNLQDAIRWCGSFLGQPLTIDILPLDQR